MCVFHCVQVCAHLCVHKLLCTCMFLILWEDFGWCRNPQQGPSAFISASGSPHLLKHSWILSQYLNCPLELDFPVSFIPKVHNSLSSQPYQKKHQASFHRWSRIWRVHRKLLRVTSRCNELSQQAQGSRETRVCVARAKEATGGRQG